MNVAPLRCVAILILTIVAVSCSATGKVNCEGNFIYNPSSFTEEQQQWIKESSARWNSWVGYPVTSVSPGYSDICHIDAGPTKSTEAIGEESSRLQNITVDVAHLERSQLLNKVWFESVVMHEMGHALGYGHVGERGKALMSPTGAPDFTEIDRIECLKLEMCKSLLPSNQVNQVNQE